MRKAAGSSRSSRSRLRARGAAGLGLAAAVAACAGELAPALRPPPPAARAPTAQPAASAPPARVGLDVVWREDFSGATLDWVAPFGHSPETVARIHSVVREPSGSFLRARHDGRRGGDRDPPPAVHFGHAFPDGVPLETKPILSWKWRVRVHPSVGDDAWQDVAASLYVVTRTPSLLFRGRGFKLGWVAHPAAAGTYQRGLLQVELRHDPASEEWRRESVDLCALHREAFGECAGESVLYVGVVTDADGTESVAEADYGDFEIAYRSSDRSRPR